MRASNRSRIAICKINWDCYAKRCLLEVKTNLDDIFQVLSNGCTAKSQQQRLPPKVVHLRFGASQIMKDINKQKKKSEVFKNIKSNGNSFETRCKDIKLYRPNFKCKFKHIFHCWGSIWLPKKGKLIQVLNEGGAKIFHFDTQSRTCRKFGETAKTQTFMVAQNSDDKAELNKFTTHHFWAMRMRVGVKPWLTVCYTEPRRNYVKQQLDNLQLCGGAKYIESKLEYIRRTELLATLVWSYSTPRWPHVLQLLKGQ